MCVGTELVQEEFQDTKGDESVNRRKTVNTMAKRKQAKGLCDPFLIHDL
jgi:hypothetical protein